jgi:DNA replication and repair protein RecF
MQQWRSFNNESRDFTFPTTEIIGDNATGKTNTLEAVYFALTGKSFRAKDRELIAYNKDWTRVEVIFDTGETLVATIDFRTGRLSKVRKINDTSVGSKIVWPVVLFEPDFIGVVSGGAEIRRSWLDEILTQLHPEYAVSLKIYQRALRQRNALLKQPNLSPDQVFVWNIKLAETGAILIKHRADFLSKVANKIEHHYQQIAHQKTKIQTNYQPKISQIEVSASTMIAALESALPTDRLRGYTTIGPHRDDVEFLRDGHSLLKTGSRGEQRTLAIALKQTELEVLKELLGKDPILLLDDVASELDATRSQLNLPAAQTILTKTN